MNPNTIIRLEQYFISTHDGYWPTISWKFYLERGFKEGLRLQRKLGKINRSAELIWK